MENINEAELAGLIINRNNRRVIHPQVSQGFHNKIRSTHKSQALSTGTGTEHCNGIFLNKVV